MALGYAGLLVVFLCFSHGYLSFSDAATVSPTAGDTSPLFSYGPRVKDMFTKDMGRNIEVDLPYNISYFGSSYGQVFISPDGMIGLGSQVNYIPGIKYAEGVRNPSTDRPFIAPFYYNAFKTSVTDPNLYQGTIYHRTMHRPQLKDDDPNYDEYLKTMDDLGPYLQSALVNDHGGFKADLVLIVTWDHVADNTKEMDGCSKSDPCANATFQAAVVADTKNTFVIFNYANMDIPIQDTFQAGLNGGSGRGWSNVIPCLGDCQHRMNISMLSDLPRLQGSDLRGRFILDVGGEVIVRGGCLPDQIQEGMMEVYPKTVGMFGGELMMVSGNCYTPNSKIYCRFGTVADSRPIIVEGEMINSMKGFCPVPILTRKGPTDIYFSKDGKNFTADTIMNVALPSRVGDPVYIQPADKEPWYSRDASIFSVPWDSKLFSDDMSIMIQVKLIGYRENSSNRKVEFKDLHSFGNRSNRDGHMTINVAQHKCLERCEDFELGLLEASVAPNNYKLAKQRVAIRYGPIPLGWWVNSALTNSRGSDWSDQKCREWNDQDSKNEAWTKNLLPCPCTLDQALADFGRWQADPGCNLFAGSECYYHKGAKHCVRSVAPTVPEGSGNQCCYNNDGTLRYSQLDYQGSTPDRSHVWGAPPYDMSDLVPSLSHWKHDVVTFYYCCLWNDYRLCDLYMEQRPTANCKNYDVPGLAFLRGDPHITTFDGIEYNFGGGGDFWLVNNYPNPRELMLQGRFEPRTNSWDFGVQSGTGTWKPKALTAIALKAGRAKIEISVAPPDPRIPHGIDIEINRMKTFFMDKGNMWQDFEDFSILNNAPSTSNNPHSNFTILLTRSSVGINVVEINRLLHITVAASPTLKSTGTGISSSATRGLLGSFDDDKDNDFTTRNKTVLSPSTNKTEIFKKFALSWAVYDNDTSNFIYNKAAEGVDPVHEYYEFKDIHYVPKGPTVSDVQGQCGDNNNCIYDFLLTGDRNVAKATKEADDEFNRVKSLAKREDNCGLPDVGNMVTLSSNDFRLDKEVKVTGCPEGMTLATEVTFKCVKETVAEASSNDRADYGVRRKYPGDDTEYIIHWTPKPYTACTGGTEDADIGMIVGIVVAVLAAVIIVIIIAYLVVKKRKSGESSIKERKASKRETTTDPVAAEAMLAGVEARSPVYRGSNKEKDETLVKGSAV